MPKTLRKKVPIHDAEADMISRLRTPGSQEAARIAEFTGINVDPSTSEAQALYALVVAGCRVADRESEEDGYRRLAEFRKTDPEHQAWRESRRRRRLARHHVGDPNTA
jgi:hypothetical protein